MGQLIRKNPQKGSRRTADIKGSVVNREVVLD